jgi:hypothetical protein
MRKGLRKGGMGLGGSKVWKHSQKRVKHCQRQVKVQFRLMSIIVVSFSVAFSFVCVVTGSHFHLFRVLPGEYNQS